MNRITLPIFLLCLLLALLVLGLAGVRTAAAQDAGPNGASANADPEANTDQVAAAGLSAFVFHAQEGVEAAEANDLAAMQREYVELRATWEAIEDSVRAADPG